MHAQPALAAASATAIFMKAKPEMRDKLFKHDIESLYKEFGTDPIKYINNAMELTMNLSLEEVSHTIHLPGIFNQTVDGVSEKYVARWEMNPQEYALWQKLTNQAIAPAAASQATTSSTLNTTTTSTTATTTATAMATTTAATTSRTTTATAPAEAAKTTLTQYATRAYKYMLGCALFSMIQTKKQHTDAEVMEKEKNYIAAVKRALAYQINKIAEDEKKSFTNMILAIAFCNVYFGIKNSEAKRGLTLEEGDEAILASFKVLQNWANKT